jgi:hypothetical protein
VHEVPGSYPVTREIVEHPTILYVLKKPIRHIFSKFSVLPNFSNCFQVVILGRIFFPSAAVNLSKNYSRMTTRINSDVAERNKMAEA